MMSGIGSRHEFGQGHGQAPERDKDILVIGASGKTGRRVMQRLMTRGLRVRAGSRTGEPPFDWEDQATWSPALRNVNAVYLTYFPDIAIPGAVDAIRQFTRLAVDQGVRHLVLLSGRGEEEAQRAEQVVRDSGIDWTILRSSWFSQNFSENFFDRTGAAGRGCTSGRGHRRAVHRCRGHRGRCGGSVDRGRARWTAL